MNDGFNLKDYVDVAERIGAFYERYPEGSIQTEMVRLEGDLVVFKATVYRDREDPHPTTGWAYEREGVGYVNRTSFIENCETSAIGRALANLGFTASRKRPSREEMEKAERGRIRFASRPPAVHERSAFDSEKQRRADAISRILRLLWRAELLGMRPRRAGSFREAVSYRPVSEANLERIEARLRGWVEREGRKVLGV